jgi:hypothetical protein
MLPGDSGSSKYFWVIVGTLFINLMKFYIFNISSPFEPRNLLLIVPTSIVISFLYSNIVLLLESLISSIAWKLASF